MVNYHNYAMKIDCDECGKELKLSCIGFNDGIVQMKKAGWLLTKNSDCEWEHYCPDCHS